ncbi:pirin family protein [Flavimarina sp. Hel_I_48]|uniref:pirin family protein n=1 Tax=Flavimarina sp. Hel_I_48 TaxID=1392488 RepID=UPI0004DF568D|nr:pirin family protein [Flavimarina sp. Hel_I_48]
MGAILKVKQLHAQWETADPFLFCAFHNDAYPRGNEQMGPQASLAGRSLGQDFVQKEGWAMYHGRTVPGFPAHPHVGFETVTIAEHGFVDHSDSLGASGRFGQGDVQWMTAGKGVQHSEMFPLIYKEKENPLLLFQIWLNLPAKNKQVEPYFGMFWHENIPVVNVKDTLNKNTEIKIVAGNYEDNAALKPNPDSWAANAKNDVNIWIISMEADATFTLPTASPEVNRSLYFFEGDQLRAEDFEIPPMHRIIADAAEELTLKNGSKPAKLLLLQGKPIGERVVQHGPFVANSNEEINAAFSRFRESEFGGWPWPSPEHTHVLDAKRFAIFPDGKEENPG